MSHEATVWAIKQRGLKPAAKLVLWHLCDRYNPDFGCFPKQELLAADCEMSRSTLNDHLAALEAAGLIRREQRRDPETRKQLPTRYRFAFEADFGSPEPGDPCPESGHGAVSETGPEPCPENGESRVRPAGHITSKGTSKGTEERESARARDSSWREQDRIGEFGDPSDDGPADDGRSSDGRSLDDMRAAWPGSRQDSQQEITDAWAGLTPAERTAALDGAEGFLAERADLRLRRVYLQTYLAERRFARPSAPVAADGARAGSGRGGGGRAAGRAGGKPYVPPFDRAWWVVIHRWTMAARTAADIHRIRAAISMAVTASAGLSLDPDEAPAAEACAAFVQVWAGSEEFEAWAAWFRRRGVHLPNRDRIWCWFPQRWPPEEAAAEAVGF